MKQHSKNSSATETTIGNSLATHEDDLEGHPIESEKSKKSKGDGDVEYQNLT